MQSLCVAYRWKLKFFLHDSPFGGVLSADAAISGLGLQLKVMSPVNQGHGRPTDAAV